jgi:hypothetical protein
MSHELHIARSAHARAISTLQPADYPSSAADSPRFKIWNRSSLYSHVLLYLDAGYIYAAVTLSRIRVSRSYRASAHSP